MIAPALRFARTRDVEPPRRAHATDAGVDFFVPRDFNDGQPRQLDHGESVLVPSGVRVAVPTGWALVFFNKSGVASKQVLDTLACVVDAGYQGEVHLNVVNNGGHRQTIAPGMKLLQGLLLPVGAHAPVEVAEGDLYSEASARGAGGFGSTGG